MTTATHTQGLQAMYSPFQQTAVPGLQPQFGPIGLGPMAYQQPYQQPYAQQFPIQYPPIPSPIAQPFQQGIEQQVAWELFRLAQLVQASSHLVGPQAGKPSRQLIAYELFRLGQLVQQASMYSLPAYQQQQFPQFQYQQFQTPQFQQPVGSVPQVPIWS